MFATATVVLVAGITATAPAPTCPPTDLRADMLKMHEMARQAHLRGDAGLIAGTLSDQLVSADDGTIRIQSQSEVTEFFAGYFRRVRYREWKDTKPPVVHISPDGQIGWMAVEIEAKYIQTDKDKAEGEKSFKSSWISTYRRDHCAWKMTGIASNVVE